MRQLRFILFVYAIICQNIFSEEPYLDLNNNLVQPLEVMDGKRANILCFTTTDCPIANGYSQRFNQLKQKYESLGYDFYLVHVDWDTTRQDAIKHQKDYDLKMRIILDPKHVLVKRTGVSITPEVAVILPNGKVAYRGRIDNWYEGFGKKRNVVNKTELEDALKLILEDKQVLIPYSKAVGCSIPDLPVES